MRIIRLLLLAMTVLPLHDHSSRARQSTEGGRVGVTVAVTSMAMGKTRLMNRGGATVVECETKSEDRLPKNCRLQKGYTLDDAVKVMQDILAEQQQEEPREAIALPRPSIVRIHL